MNILLCESHYRSRSWVKALEKNKNLHILSVLTEEYNLFLDIGIPKNKICLQLIQNLKKPITSTSANFTGKKVPKYFEQIDKDLLDLVNYSINFDNNQQNKSSRIVSIDDNSNVKIIRN